MRTAFLSLQPAALPRGFSVLELHRLFYTRRVTALFACLTAAAIGGYAQPPRIFSRGVVNAASYAPAGVPGGGIAQGSIFTIFGANLGPTTGVQATSFPIQTSLSNVSIRFVLGSNAVNVLPLYVSAGQINALMPSNAPTGLGALQVTANNQRSNNLPVQVVSSSLGVFSVASSGMGPGVVQNFVSQTNQPVNSLQVTAKPGDTITVYGTGLGAISAPDNVAPPAGTLPVKTEAWVGGQSATVLYSGRSPCCSGLDQIVLTIPQSTVLGCWVPVYFRTAGTTTSNAVTIAVSANGAPCSEPNNPLAQTFIQGGTAGTVRLIQSSVREDVATIASTDVSTDVFNYDLSQLQGGSFVFAPLFSQPPAGSCTLFQLAGDYWGSNGGFPIPTTAVRSLDAGTFSISGATNANLAPATAGFPGVFLGSYVSSYFPNQLVLNPGASTLTASGGADVHGFSAAITIPQPFTWTGREQLSSINRGQPLTLSWIGLPAGQQMSILGGNVDLPSNSSAIFYCVAPANASSFTIPTAVLGAMPATRADPRKSKGAIYLVNSSPGNGTPVSATGLNAAVALPMYMFGKLVIFQ